MSFCRVFAAILALYAWSMALQAVWNAPHPVDSQQRVGYRFFSSPPKTLDPARSYASNEAMFLGAVVEPPLTYDYLKRPYALVPLTLASLPRIVFYNAKGQVIHPKASYAEVAKTVYQFTLRSGIRYQPHPAFAMHGQTYRYWPLRPIDLRGVKQLKDFSETGTRALQASDYVYAIKRLANPEVGSPIEKVLEARIIGFRALHQVLLQRIRLHPQAALDYRDWPLEGVKLLGPSKFEVMTHGFDPQFLYWFTMSFMAPIPWEVDRWYAEPGLREKSIGWDSAPVGTGPYYLSLNEPNRLMVLSRNPYYHMETYPDHGSNEDQAHGLLERAGERLPAMDAFYYYFEKESVPMWMKFRQGFYDASGVSEDQFNEAIELDAQGNMRLSPKMKAQGVRLYTQVQPGIFYLAFNMLDPVVGGASPRTRALRQAIDLAVDFSSYIELFLNGRGELAFGPIPPGLEGYAWERSAGLKAWGSESDRLHRARELMKVAGYPGGMNPKTGRPLVLFEDVASNGGPEQHAVLAWMRQQFKKIGIDLQIRSTQYNRFQSKLRTGRAQIFSFGWMADYADPENFFFLFYGPNGKVRHGGENAANYENKAFDAWYDQLKLTRDPKLRLQLIQKMLNQLNHDRPWVWGYYPKLLVLHHRWNEPIKINPMLNNIVKYEKLDPNQRLKHIQSWNQPKTFILYLMLALLLVMLGIGWYLYRQRQASWPSKRFTLKDGMRVKDD